MSTRGYIIVKVKDESKGKNLKFDKSKLSENFQLRDSEKWNGNEFDELTDDIWQPTKEVTADYLAIYNQSDSYPTGAGKTLLKHFNDYDKALNLVAGGTTESIFRDHINYSERRRKSLADDPDYADGPTLQIPLPTVCESWQYLFYNDRWYVRQWGARWYDLEEYLTAKGNEADYDLPEMIEHQEIPSWTTDEQAHDVALAKFESLWYKMLPEGDGLDHVK